MSDSLSRRTFLVSGAAAATALATTDLPAATASRTAESTPPLAAPKKRKLLVLGGTGFLGPAIVRAGLAKGHEFSLFHRGKTNPGLFPEVEHLTGQRRRPDPADPKSPPQDLKALENGRWDAVIDTSGYYTGEVEDACKALAGKVEQYVYISSLSVYRSLGEDATPVDEQSPLCECDDKYTLDMGKGYERYGALKRYCEDAVGAAFGERATLVRPGYIVGPEDPTDRFTYWPARFQRGGECLAPGDPDNELQFVDVRDLGEWLVHLIEQRITGPLNAVGFAGRISTAEFLHTGKGTLNHGCSFTWVDDAFLERQGVSSWGEMGCWTPKAKNGRTSNQKAIAAGASYRPIAETIRDTAAWVLQGRGDRPWRKGVGMTAERERDLLAKWKAR